MLSVISTYLLLILSIGIRVQAQAQNQTNQREPVCPSHHPVYELGLCYKDCMSKEFADKREPNVTYRGVTSVCWPDCAEGWKDVAGVCWKGAQSYTKAHKTFGRGVGIVP